MNPGVAALAAFAALLGTVVWCAWAWFFPYTFHRRCRGRKGQGAGSTKYGWSRCRAKRCKNGEVVRYTARVISKLVSRPVRGSEAK